MKILVLNSGSSSIKFQLIETDSEMIASNTDRCLGKGIVERIGTDEASLRLEAPAKQCKPQIGALLDHQIALTRVLEALRECGVIADISQVQAVGHRVVHGGEQFSHSVLMDEEVAKAIQLCSELAPLRSPTSFGGCYGQLKLLPQVPKVAFSDTSFHRSSPPNLYLDGIPYTSYPR